MCVLSTDEHTHTINYLNTIIKSVDPAAALNIPYLFRPVGSCPVLCETEGLMSAFINLINAGLYLDISEGILCEPKKHPIKPVGCGLLCEGR